MTSASSSLNFGVQTFEFGPGVVDVALPVDATLLFVGVSRPGGNVFGKCRYLSDTTAGQALPRHRTAFTCGPRQPPAMLGSVHALEPLHVGACHRWCHRCVACSRGVRMEIVQHQSHVLTGGIPCVEPCGPFLGPSGVGALRPGGALPTAGKRFGTQEKTGGAVALVVVIDSLGMMAGCRTRCRGLCESRHGVFIHAQDGTRWMGRPRGGFPHVFPARHARGVVLWRHHPGVEHTRGHAVFLRVWRTVAGQSDSTTSSLTR
jgi:hypothetical protein